VRASAFMKWEGKLRVAKRPGPTFFIGTQAFRDDKGKSAESLLKVKRLEIANRTGVARRERRAASCE